MRLRWLCTIPCFSQPLSRRLTVCSVVAVNSDKVLTRDRKIDLDPVVDLAPRLVDQPQRIGDALFDLLGRHFDDAVFSSPMRLPDGLVGFGRKPVVVRERNHPKAASAKIAQSIPSRQLPWQDTSRGQLPWRCPAADPPGYAAR